MLPIVHRELQVAARSSKLYKWRVRTGLLVILVASAMVLTSQAGLRPGAAGSIFQALSFIALLVCLLEGTRKCSDSVSEEKREGTLGLLFLTDLKGFDIILGKLAAALVRSVSVLFAFVPVLAISLLLGGTTAGEFWRMVLVLFTVLFTSLSICLLVSTIGRSGSISASLVILGIWSLVPFVLGFIPFGRGSSMVSAFSPFALYSLSTDAYYIRESSSFWMGILSVLAMAVICLAVASRILPHVWQDRPRVQNLAPLRDESRSAIPSRRRELLERNPVAWLFGNLQGIRRHRSLIWTGAGLIIVEIISFEWILPFYGFSFGDGPEVIVAFFVVLGATIVTALYVARESSRNLAEARSNGALELVLSTPVTVPQIISGQWLALRPVITSTLILVGVVSVWAALLGLASETPIQIFMVAKLALQTALSFYAAGWTGLWMALTSKSAARAFFRTVFVGLMLPFLICTPTILNQIVLIVIASERVKSHFRKYVTDRYLQQEAFILAPVTRTSSSTPPVLR